MSRFPGNIIKLPNVTPTQSSAQGVWSLKDQLVYQRNNQWPFQRDPYFNYTTLLLQGNVPNTTGPQAMTQPLAYNSDASTNNFLITPNGDVSPRPFSPYGGGNYSVYFSGSPYLSIADTASLNFAGDFTVECWVYTAGGSGARAIIHKADTNVGYEITMLSGGNLTASCGSLGITGTTVLPANQWVHVAIVRSGSSTNNFRLYVNGSQDAQGTNTSATGGTVTLGVGAVARSGAAGVNPFTGYISNVRIGSSAVYSGNFTPPTDALQSLSSTSLLVCQSNRFIDNSGTPKTVTPVNTPRVTDNSPFVSTDFTTGAGYFNSSSNYLSVADKDAWDFGTGQFMMEASVYFNGTSLPQTFIAQLDGLPGNGMYFRVTSNGLEFGFGDGAGSVVYAAALTIVAGAWYHFAVTRDSGNTLRLFSNGVLLGSSASFTKNLTGSTADLWLGRHQIVNWYLNGYMANVRISKGSIPTGYQTSSTTVGATIFTPPSTPITTTSQGATAGDIQLLTLQTRAASQNIGFIDSSPNEFIVTKNGNTTQGTFSPFSPTGWGNYFDGSTAYLTVAANSAINDFGTGDFNIECWFYATTSNFTAEPSLISCVVTWATSVAYQLEIRSGGVVYFFGGDTAPININSGATTVSVNTWNHVAVSRASGTTRLFVNGTQVSSTSTVATISKSSTAVQIGAFSTGVQKFTGYMSNVRIVKGQALYTGNFTPPTAALTTTSVGTSGANVATSVTGTVGLLTCQSNRFIDQTGKTITVTGTPSVQAFSPFAPATQSSPLVTGGSGYFDGNDYLSAPDSDAWHFGAGDFTLEAWYYPTTTNAQQIIIAQSSAAGGGTGLSWQLMTSNDSNVYLRALVSSDGSGWVFDLISTSKLQINAWNHVAFVRSGTAFQLYINGAAATNGSATSSASLYNTTTPLTVGASNSPNQYVTGYVSGVRVVKGTAVYSGTNYVVPTAPPTAIPNTSLLLNFTGGGIVDATGRNVIETFGNAQIATSLTKWAGAGSISNNGASGTRLQVSSSSAPPQFNMGTGDYTVEFWINAGTPAAQQCILDFRNADVAGQGYALIFNTSRQLIMYYNVGNRITTSAISANVWTHVAVVRYNGVYTIYLDGSSSGGTYNNSDAVAPPANRPLIGSVSDGSQVFNGNLSNFRISRMARYTSNFNTNLPTGPFPIG